MSSKKKSKITKLFVKKFIVLFLTIFFFIYIGNYFIVYAHEQVHVAIFNSYHIESEVHINYFILTGYTSVDLVEYELKCNEECMLAHDIAEAIGYHLLGFYYAIWFIVLFIWLITNARENKK